MAYSKSVNLANAQTAVPCNVCEDDVPGEYYCKECKQTLCPHCEKNHKRVTATKNHNVVLRTQVGDLDTTILSCTDHGDQASLHCEKCNIAVCMKCVTGKHKGHDMSDLDALQKEKIVLQNDIKRMQGALQTLQKQLGELLTEKKKYKKKIETILEDMENENQATMNELQKIHKERLDNINNIQDSHMAMYEGFEVEMKTRITSYEKRVSEYEDTLAKNNLPDLRILTKEQLSLSEIGSKPELPDPPIFVQGNVQTIMENLGKLHISFSPISKPLKLVSKFKCPLKGYPRICITKEGDVWLGGYDSRELVMVDINGQVLGRRKIQNRPNALAVMECDDIIISPRSGESSSVSRLHRDDRVQQVFDTSPSWSYGISVTANQKILICTYDGRVVMTNGDGSKAKQIYKGSGDVSAAHAVENSDGNIYISDKDKGAVVMIDKVGEILATITHTPEGKKMLRPAGIVVDRMGNILCGDIINGCIFIIDQNKLMRELIGRSHGIQRPGLMALDNDNNLWITESDGNVIVVKYVCS